MHYLSGARRPDAVKKEIATLGLPQIGILGWSLLAIGGVIGTWVRFAIGIALGGPGGTLAINLAGCFVLGVVGTFALIRPDWVSAEARLLLGVGFCGAFTTFSTFGFETLALLQAGRPAAALGYVALSNVLGLAATAGGWLVARSLG
jgi:CrcB protein